MRLLRGIIMPSTPRSRASGVRGLISILLAISMLGIIAAAAAMWSDSLKIQSTIRTGDVDIRFGGSPVTADIETKDVGKCFAEFKEIQDEEQVVRDNYPQWGSNAGNNDLELNITIVNGYPSYICKVNNISVVNSGTVPVKILAKLVLPPNATCTSHIDPLGNLIYDCDMDGDGDLDLNIWGSFVTTNTTQLEPGGSKTFTVELHVKQGAPENATFSLELLLIGIQWNEFP
ncbi:MAG TPA: hypothetical protein VNL13_02175 [Sulfolobales archaeon]|nr:hypothetical protein [Sulfolobales archaeon]